MHFELWQSLPLTFAFKSSYQHECVCVTGKGYVGCSIRLQDLVLFHTRLHVRDKEFYFIHVTVT